MGQLLCARPTRPRAPAQLGHHAVAVLPRRQVGPAGQALSRALHGTATWVELSLARGAALAKAFLPADFA
jgi:hypothetical protein